MVDRWFAGIKAKYNYWKGTTFIAPEGKDSYFMKYHVMCTNSTYGVKFTLFATPHCTEHNPAQLEKAIAHHPRVNAWEDSLDSMFIQIKEKTRLFPIVQSINAASSTQIAEGLIVVLPYTPRERTLEQVKAEMKRSNTTRMWVKMTTTDTNEHIFEFEVDDAKRIIQPYHQATPAVADELFVSSTSVNDTLAGTGAQKIKFDYYDAANKLYEDNEIEMNGTTPVDIIATYANVAYIKRTWVSQVGSLGHNDGDIFFHDAA